MYEGDCQTGEFKIWTKSNLNKFKLLNYLYMFQRCQPASVRLMDNEQFKFGQALRHRTGILGAFKENLKKFYLFVIKNFEVENICVMTLLFEGKNRILEILFETIDC